MRCKQNEIPLIEAPANFVGRLVHVEGWNYACVFRLENTDGTNHVLVTPKTGRVFRTRNRLKLTRKEHEKQAND